MSGTLDRNGRTTRRPTGLPAVQAPKEKATRSELRAPAHRLPVGPEGLTANPAIVIGLALACWRAGGRVAIPAVLAHRLLRHAAA